MDFFEHPGRDKPGYLFDGWYVDEARTLRLNPAANLPHHVTIYDKWVPIEYPVTYHLAYGINNRRNPKTISVESGIHKLFPPIQSQSFFEGWYWNGKRVEYLPEGLHEEVELTARFCEVPVVSFETGQGARIAPKQVNAQGHLKPFQPPMRPGYLFDGWFEDEEHSRSFSFSSSIRNNITLYAAWKQQVYEIVYTLNGGYFEEEPIRSFVYDDETIWLPKPKRTGYRFCGWKDRFMQDVACIPAHTSAKRVLQATWQQAAPEIHAMSRKTPENLMEDQISKKAARTEDKEQGSDQLTNTQNDQNLAGDVLHHQNVPRTSESAAEKAAAENKDLMIQPDVFCRTFEKQKSNVKEADEQKKAGVLIETEETSLDTPGYGFQK